MEKHIICFIHNLKMILEIITVLDIKQIYKNEILLVIKSKLSKQYL